MSRDINLLNPILPPLHVKAAEIFKSKYPDLPQPFICCTHRPNNEQEENFYIGRDRATGKVLDKRLIRTNARPGESPHNYIPSPAFDIAFAKGKVADYSHHLFQKYADIILSLSDNIVWGYDWNGNKIRDKNDFDAPHFELKNWKQLVKYKPL